AAANAYAPTTQALASAWPSSRASPKHTTEPSPSPPGTPAGSASRCNYPPRHRTPADDDQGNRRARDRGRSPLREGVRAARLGAGTRAFAGPLSRTVSSAVRGTRREVAPRSHRYSLTSRVTPTHHAHARRRTGR